MVHLTKLGYKLADVIRNKTEPSLRRVWKTTSRGNLSATLEAQLKNNRAT